jgi:hypothetical protein
MNARNVQRFQGKGTDLGDLRTGVESYLTSEGFVVQTAPAGEDGTVIQAKRGDRLSEVFAADRALSVLISGEPDDFTVRIGLGRWRQHLGVAAAETVFLSALFLPIDVVEMAWNVEVELKLARHIESLIG